MNLQRAHADLSELSLRFLQFAQEEPQRALAIRYDQLPVPDWMRPYLKLQQSWPTFVGPEWVEDLSRVSRGVVALIRRIPECVFGSDGQRMAEVYPGTPPPLFDLLLTPPNGLDTSVARCDLIAPPDRGLQVLEVNLGAYLGGFAHHFLSEACLEHPTLQSFLDGTAAELVFRDPIVSLFEHVVRDTLSHDIVEGRTLHLAFTTDPEQAPLVKAAGPVLGRILSRVTTAVDSSLEGKVTVLALPQGVELRGQQVLADGERVHAIVEYSGVPTPAPVFRSFKARKVTVYNGPMARILTSKLALALLSETQDNPEVWGAEERRFLRDHVPWTRRVRDVETAFRGQRLPLEELLRLHREDLVLKLADSARGEGVRIGATMPQEAWNRLLDEALHGPRAWIVQERVESRPYLYRKNSETACPHDVIWGPYCFGDTYGGTYLRMLPKGQGDGIVNATRGAVEGMVFEVRS